MVRGVKGVAVNRTKIEWANYTWNPIKGLCPEACWYCYARRLYSRFGMDPRLRLDYHELVEPAKILGPSRIFVCSTMELFHPRIPERWRQEIFNIIAALSSVTFIVLTKYPERIIDAMPDNVWLGVTVTEDREVQRIVDLHGKTEARVKFVSFEPLLGAVFVNHPNGLLCGLEWVIIGRLTGHGHHRDPALEDILPIVRIARGFEIPVFLKNNLSDIWPGPLIQEFPK